MQALITEKREKIIEVCRQHYVQRLAVFGSAARDDFDPERSDVDFLVEFQKAEEFRYAQNYFDLQRALAEVLGRDVDLVTYGTIKNPFLLRNILADEQLLYAA